MSDKERYVIEQLSKLPGAVQERFIAYLEGAAAAMEIFPPQLPTEDEGR